jgi:MoaA/NifB/PqqE/SkfB family radical SAM enzyme
VQTLTKNQASLESGWDRFKNAVLEGGPGTCQFAINNACNAGCDFCNFNFEKLPKDRWEFVPLSQAREAVDILYRQGIRYLIITGGEPMMHPDYLEIIRHAGEKRMAVLLVTNGSMLNEARIRTLKDHGLTSMIISIDAASAELHEQNRRLPGVCDRIREANRLLKQAGIQTTASVTMSRLIDDYAGLAPFLKDLGFEHTTFSYPLSHLKSSFLGYADSRLVEYEPEELSEAFSRVKELKKSFPVINPTASLDEMQRFLRKESQLFPCLGGYKYFYLDWKLFLWRCHYWEKPMCSIYEFTDESLIRDGCTRCMIDCYRDASVLQHIAVSVSDAVGHARKGKLVSASKTLFTKANYLSIKSVIENLRWILRI